MNGYRIDCRPHVIFQLFYGAGLLTAITVAPDISIHLRMDKQLVIFTYPEIWISAVIALIFTFLAMLPTIITLPNGLTRFRIINVLPTVPWISLCCIKFFNQISMYIFAIRHMNESNDSTPLIKALICYCIIFIMSIEIMLHWISIALMSTAGNVVLVLPKGK
ncbi:hypothetical protein KR200_005772 [Drosophila serrata]|nr:hypothetical protein KR200_005772 [Drosophila serrata]